MSDPIKALSEKIGIKGNAVNIALMVFNGSIVVLSLVVSVLIIINIARTEQRARRSARVNLCKSKVCSQNDVGCCAYFDGKTCQPGRVTMQGTCQGKDQKQFDATVSA